MDRAADAATVVDREESDPFRLEHPTLAVGARCGRQGHRDPDVVGAELVRYRLPERFGPSMHFHFDGGDCPPAGPDQIGSTTKNRHLPANVEPFVNEPCRDRLAEVRLETEC